MVDLGIYSRTDVSGGIDPTDKMMLVISVVWVLFCLLFLAVVGLGEGGALGPLRFLIAFLVIILPVALLWVGSISLKGARVMREESQRLQASLDAMRQVYVSQAQMAATTMGPNVERKIDELVRRQRLTETALSSMSVPPVPETAPPARAFATQPSVPAEEVPQEQPSLAFASGPAPESVSIYDFISAMNFPETTEDRDGFIALRKALADPRASRLIRASQDVLTLLSQDGIYMDDLVPDRARPEVWRKFAAGERGLAIAGLGGIRDRSSLALSSSRMRQDQVFRDSAHHFLRAFDQTFSQMVDDLSDQDIASMAETRTARAFMLLGRVAGVF
jgi:Zn-dependent protease with chaperone function